MTSVPKQLLSVVVPVFNEQAGLERFHKNLTAALKAVGMAYEIIYCDDGSTDSSPKLLYALALHDKTVKVMRLSRNFGKEIATTAGLHTARGDAIITIDADGQHPVELIQDFLVKWHQGAKVVIGVRSANQKEGLVKRAGSRLFNGLFRRMTGIQMMPRSTDFRLIDHTVQAEFVRMTERNRITRGLIDWLGYRRDYIEYRANPRLAGNATYTFRKLFKLAIDSAVSLSISPLYITAYIGAVVLPIASLLGLGMLINAALSDPLNLHATGGAYLMVLILFLIGILMVSQGIIGLYLSHIHTETQNRPLYVIDHEQSRGI